jgi:hypothetical protein
VYEPFNIRKLHNVFRALTNLQFQGTVGVLSRSLDADTIRNVALVYSLCCKPICPDASITDHDAAKRTDIKWTAIVAPFELTVGSACRVADHLGVYAHSSAAADLSRDKRRFRSMVTESWGKPFSSQRPLILALKKDDRELADLIIASFGAGAELVLKPVDAGGSVGVCKTSATDAALAVALRDLRAALREMGRGEEMSSCDLTEVLAEPWFEGEEFSVESRARDGAIETLAVHWKPDIDAGLPKFFERIFVTLPPCLHPYGLLERANADLLHEFEPIGLVDGVFHSEFRVDPHLEVVYPLEIGLRPGGGMVPPSVRASRSVDIYEELARAALRLPASRPRPQRTVATTHLYAATPGTLMSLSLVDINGGEIPIKPTEPDEVVQQLNHLIRCASRSRLTAALTNAASSGSPLAAHIRSAASSLSGPVAARVESFEAWYQQPQPIIHPEREELAGLLVTADPTLHFIEAVAEAVAATALCSELIRVNVLP